MPGVLKVAAYHREDRNYDCRPKWMAVAALGRFDDESAVPVLIPLVDHGNLNTRMWARASLARLTGKSFGADKKAWGEWWNNLGKEPRIDDDDLLPWQYLKKEESGVVHEEPPANLSKAEEYGLSQEEKEELVQKGLTGEILIKTQFIGEVSQNDEKQTRLKSVEGGYEVHFEDWNDYDWDDLGFRVSQIESGVRILGLYARCGGTNPSVYRVNIGETPTTITVKYPDGSEKVYESVTGTADIPLFSDIHQGVGKSVDIIYE
jgi:hypothetical protein